MYQSASGVAVVPTVKLVTSPTVTVSPEAVAHGVSIVPDPISTLEPLNILTLIVPVRAATMRADRAAAVVAASYSAVVVASKVALMRTPLR
jgi:hypothetical protein